MCEYRVGVEYRHVLDTKGKNIHEVE